MEYLASAFEGSPVGAAKCDFGLMVGELFPKHTYAPKLRKFINKATTITLKLTV